MAKARFELSLLDLDTARIEAAARFYGDNGFLVLTDVDTNLVLEFEEVLDPILEALGIDLREVIDGRFALNEFTQEQRKRLSQVDCELEVQAWLVETLEPLLLRLLGPLVHVSRNFHAQFKGGDLAAPNVDHGGYPSGTEFLEPFGQYLLHQDFTGANLPTSPGFITVWVPLTTSEHWGLRLYPGSHHRGILCNDWVELDDERLEMLGEPVEFPAERGRALLFHGLLMHSTANPGASRRVSCDVRFFPLCGFLPTTPWLLSEHPKEHLAPVPADDEILRASRLETRVYLGQPSGLDRVPDHSVLNWVRYIEHRVGGDPGGAIEHLERFTNAALTGETATVYRDKYHHHPLCLATMERARRALDGPDPASHPQPAA